MQGSPAVLASSGVDFAKLVGGEEKPESEEKAEGRSRSCSRSSVRSQRSMSTTSLAGSMSDVFIPEPDDGEGEPEPQAEMEASSKGKVKENLLLSYLHAGAHWSVIGVLFIMFVVTQILASGADKWVSYWTRQEELRLLQRKANGTDPLIEGDDGPLLSTETCIYIHGGLMLALAVFALTRSFSYYTITVRASQKLHDMMFKGIVSTTMRFFDTNPSGRILNRFSKDIGAIDEFLPKSVLDATQIILNMAGAIIVAALVNPLFLVPVAVLAFFFIYVRKVYLKTSKNIKRLEGISKRKERVQL